MATWVECNGVQFEQCKEIIKSYNCPIPSEEALWKKLSEEGGTLLNGNTYLWLDSEGRFSVEIYAKGLTIASGSNPDDWTYNQEKIPDSDYTVEVAKLLNVSWLDVKGAFNMANLTGRVVYEIFFDIELTSDASGWCNPVTFEHNTPSGTQEKFDKKLDCYIGQGRVQISIGTFVVSSGVSTHYATFTMHEHGVERKSGLIMRGVIIKPKH